MMRRQRVMLGAVAFALTVTVIMYNALTTLYTNHTKYPGRQKSGYPKITPRIPEQKPGKAPHLMLRSIREEPNVNNKEGGIMPDVSKDIKRTDLINYKVKDVLTKEKQSNQRNSDIKDVLLKIVKTNKRVLNSKNVPSKISNKESNNNSNLKPTAPIHIKMKHSKSILNTSKIKNINYKYKSKKKIDSPNLISDKDQESSNPGQGWWREHLCQPSPAPWRYKKAEVEPLTLTRELSYLESTDKNIFLLETSCAQVLGPRIWCAVESLAHKHPEHQVTLLLTSPTLDDAPGKEYLRADGQRHFLPNNVHLVYADLEDLFMDSTLEKVYLSGSWYAIPDLTVLNMSDMLRVLLVHKYGGIYLDLDIINIKPLDDLTNFVGRQDDLIANGVFGFKKGHWFTKKLLSMISSNFMAGPRGHNGPEMFTKAVLQECGDKALRNHKQTTECNEFNVLAPANFYPVPYKRWMLYFKPGKGSTFLKSWSKAYLLHFWNEFSSNTSVTLGAGSAYDILASLHCPRLYREVMHSSTFLI